MFQSYIKQLDNIDIMGNKNLFVRLCYFNHYFDLDQISTGNVTYYIQKWVQFAKGKEKLHFKNFNFDLSV